MAKRTIWQRLKYKNIAIALAILLILIILIVNSCSKNEDVPDDSDDNLPQTSVDNTEPEVPEPVVFEKYDMITVSSEEIGKGYLVLVNNNTVYNTQVDEDSLSIVGQAKTGRYPVKDYTVLLDNSIIAPLDEMMKGFLEATNLNTVMILSGYRTYEKQQELYNDELESTGQDSSTLVAKPGYSEHHTGLAIDFKVYNTDGTYQDFDGTGDYVWFSDNSYKYGFINRYPADKTAITMIDNEPWHFRYVGIPHATAMKKNGLCLEEYVDLLKNYTVDTGFFEVSDDSGTEYRIYYVAGGDESTNIPIPLKENGQPYEYTYSGNNVDGFIVTVTMN